MPRLCAAFGENSAESSAGRSKASTRQSFIRGDFDGAEGLTEKVSAMFGFYSGNP